MHFDFIVVGNGSIGTLTAIKLSEKYPGKKICLIGPQNRHGSASVAAGAMAAVFGEVEDCCESHYELEKDYLSIGLRGRKLWRDFLQQYKESEIITCEDTIVFLKDGYSEFEAANFTACTNSVMDHNLGQYLNKPEIEEAFPFTNHKVNSAIKLIGEFSICTVQLFKKLDGICEQQKIVQVDKKVSAIDPSNTNIILEGGDIFSAGKIILAAGSQSAKILKKDNIIPMLQGVGIALAVQNVPKNLTYLSKNVYRSVNRGGAQCGMHCVPRSDGTIYVGAGNYVSLPKESMYRFETIKYLIDAFSDEVANASIGYSSIGVLCHGYRPRSLDGRPLIGPLANNDNIFVATATNRVGFTWAPDIANQVLNWIGQKDLNAEYNEWGPSRRANSLMTEKEAISYFCESRYAAAIEHRLFNPTDPKQAAAKKLEIEQAARQVTDTLVNKCGFQIPSVHPDNWNAIISSQDYNP